MRVHSVIFNRSKLRKMCLIRTSRSCRLNAIFFLRKILKNNFENGLVWLIVYRDYNVIELSMKKNNKKKKIERSIEHFTFYFTLSYFHENSIYTAFERAHCTGKGSTLRLRLFFSDIQILSMGSLRLNFLIDIVNLKPKKLLEPFSSKHL